jgi:DNA polymerase-3 subunit gamma/tau
MRFDDVVGQEHITRTLRNSLKTGRIRHAYLFSGPRGTGKTTSARLLAKAVNCLDEDLANRPCDQCSACIAINEGRYLDLIEIDAATHTGVDDVRDLRDKIAFTPSEGHYKVYIIDEVHRFSGSAFDALLKTLEEPPDHAVFVLATTEIDKVPSTIKSRCLQFEFRRVSMHEVADRLQLITETEGLKAERAALELIARQGTGSVRDSISLLDQIVTDPEEVITLELAQRVLGTASISAVKEVVQAIIDKDSGEGLRIINSAIDSGSDPRQFGQQVVEHLRAVMLAQTAGASLLEVSQEDQALYEDQALQFERAALLRAVRAFNDAVNNYKGGWQPQLTLELALIESTREPEVTYTQPVYTQQATQQIIDAPEAEQLPPGEPPVIPLATVRDRWNSVLGAVYQRSKSAPAVMKEFGVRRVDGNTVYIGTNNNLYFERLNHPEKIRVIEWALTQVYGTPLRLKVEQVNDPSWQPNSSEEPEMQQQPESDDPLVSAAKDLGAEVHRRDNQES